MTPATQGAASVAAEFGQLLGGCVTQEERIALWTEHCIRKHRAEDKGWLSVFTILGFVAVFVAGYCIGELVR